MGSSGTTSGTADLAALATVWKVDTVPAGIRASTAVAAVVMLAGRSWLNWPLAVAMEPAASVRERTKERSRSERSSSAELAVMPSGRGLERSGVSMGSGGSGSLTGRVFVGRAKGFSTAERMGVGSAGSSRGVVSGMESMDLEIKPKPGLTGAVRASVGSSSKTEEPATAPVTVREGWKSAASRVGGAISGAAAATVSGDRSTNGCNVGLGALAVKAGASLDITAMGSGR